MEEIGSKHTVSLGFFKLALVSGCEPFQRLREELKSYVLKHNLLTEHEEATKVVLKNFNIEPEKLKFVEDKPLANKAEKSASTNAGNLKPKSLNSSALSVTDSNQNSNLKKNNSNISETQKKSQKSKTDYNCGFAKGKKLAKEAISDEAWPFQFCIKIPLPSLAIVELMSNVKMPNTWSLLFKWFEPKGGSWYGFRRKLNAQMFGITVLSK